MTPDAISTESGRDFLHLETPQVRAVLQIAQDIINANQNVNLEQLFITSRRKLKLPRQQLFDIIDFLTSNHIIVEGTRFTKDSVLGNPNRYKILQIIRENFGIHFSDLKRLLNTSPGEKLASSGQLIWHLGLLLKFKHIKRLKVANKTLFLPFELGTEEGVIRHLLKDSTNRKILAILAEQDFLPKATILDKSNEVRDIINYRIKKLVELGFLVLKTPEDLEFGINVEKKPILRKVLAQSQTKVTPK